MLKYQFVRTPIIGQATGKRRRLSAILKTKFAFEDSPMRQRLFFFVWLLCLTIPLHAQDDDPYTIALQRIQQAADIQATELDL
jgi:hypothetical protein